VIRSRRRDRAAAARYAVKVVNRSRTVANHQRRHTHLPLRTMAHGYTHGLTTDRPIDLCRSDAE
jgi:hypothetical protein